MVVANRKLYWWSRVTLLLSVMVLVVGEMLYGSLPLVKAVSCGDVQVTGSSWLQTLGVDSHSNAPYDGGLNNDASCGKTGIHDLNANPPQYGDAWQCVELPQRLYNTRGWYSGVFVNVGIASQIFTNASQSGFTTQAQGSIVLANVVPGDMLVTTEFGGHVMVVDHIDFTNNKIYAVDQNGADGGRTTVTFSNGSLSDGTYYNFSGAGVVHSPNDHLKNGSVVGDWDGDGKTNYTTFRPSNGTWHWRTTSGGDNSQQFGQSGDIPVPGWYTSDGKLDYAVYRPSNGSWHVLPQGGSEVITSFGLPGDIPAPGDYDGVGHTEYAVFRPSNGTWHWYCGGDCSVGFGLTGDIPAPAMWDGGAKTEAGLFRPSDGTWHWRSSNGADNSQQFGQSGDDPFPGYYSGATKPDYGQFRPSNSSWYWFPQGGAGSSLGFGSSGDIPMPGNYGGTSSTNFGVFRPSNGTWHWYCSGDCSTSYGLSGDIPAVSVLPYPILHSLGLL